MNKKITIGTRGSRLALWQSEWVKAALLTKYPECEVTLKIIHTIGDKILDTALSKIGDKGLFTKEIEEQLLDGTVDLAVHSLKDMPTATPDALKIAVITAREDPADALVSKNNLPLEAIPSGAIVLTGSLRRRAQLLHFRDDLNIQEVRGNVQTRLQKLDDSDAAAIVLAAAGLKRLGLTDRISQRLDPARFLPACGQGALALEIRSNDTSTAKTIAFLDDRMSRATVTAERTVLARLEGGCQIPIGAYAQINGDQLHLRAMVADLSGKNLIDAEACDAIDQAEAIGNTVACEILKKGGRAILDDIIEHL
ncbi:MAG: hydroxymethylbilane synthase [Phycisphaerae bacterium]|nr:hydroxymethylbilane synthase [Phycisphaerae bacterium]